MKNYIINLIQQLPSFDDLMQIKNNNIKNNTIQIFVSFNTICNFSCKYCYAKSKKQLQININQLYDFLILHHNQFNKNIDLYLVGGEPTLHPDIIIFCKLCSKLNYIHIYVHSNFSANLNIYIKLLVFPNVSLILSWHIQNSIFSSNAKKLKEIYNYSKFKKQLFIIMYEHENTLLAKMIYKTLEKIDANIELSLIDLNVKRINNIYKYTNEQINDAIQFSNKNKEPNIIFKYNNGKELYLSEFQYNCLIYYKYIKSFNNWKCESGNSQLYIHTNGDIYPCMSRYYLKQYAIGNYAMKKIPYIANISCCRHCQCISISKTRIFF